MDPIVFFYIIISTQSNALEDQLLRDENVFFFLFLPYLLHENINSLVR